MRSVEPRRLRAVASILLTCGAAVQLAACNTNTNRGITATVGVDTGVALQTAGSATSLLEGASLNLAASVNNPSNGDGVSWSITGVGTLSSVTNSTAVYVAPAAVTGASDALITATSIANPAQYASVTLIVAGTPVNNTPTPFPANVSVPYAGEVSVAGGEQPFTWTLSSGTLPPGLSLSGSSTGVTTVAGTPTAAGSYSFVLQAEDTLSRIALVSVTLTVNPEAACLLSGNFTFLVSGYRGGGPFTHSGAIAIDGTSGNITGIQDYKDGHRTTPAETLTSGSCTNRENNAGSIKLNAPSGTLVYNFAATPPDSSGRIHSAAMQLISSGSDSGSGHITLQDQTAITATAPSGNFAFGLIGLDSAGLHFGSAGRLTTDASGTISAGLIDSNDAASVLTDATLTGTLSAPNANGRGTATLTSGAQSTSLVYYQINAGKMFIMDIDPGATTPILSGQMTAQVGDVSPAIFDNNALGSPSIMSLFGASGTAEPISVMALGQLANGNATAGTVDLTLDTSYQDIPTAGQLYSGQSYTIASNGRGMLTLADSFAVRTFALYFDGIANGYIVEQGSVAGSAGLLEAQFQGPYANPPVSGIFPDTLANNFVGVTQYPQSHGPVGLAPLLALNYGALSSTYTSGNFAISPTIGRGLGTLTTTGLGSTSAALYIVSPTKIDILHFGTRAIDGSIDFLSQN